MQIWGTEKPDVMTEKPVHPAYVTVWLAISRQGIIGPYFFENSEGKRETVRQDNYQRMIETFLCQNSKNSLGMILKTKFLCETGQVLIQPKLHLIY